MPADQVPAVEVLSRESGPDVKEGPAPSETTSPESSWKDGEQQVLPLNNLPLVFCSLMLTLFLVSSDGCRTGFLTCFADKIIISQHRLLWTKQCSSASDRFCRKFSKIRFISVATALPTIVSDLGGGQNYSWVGR